MSIVSFVQISGGDMIIVSIRRAHHQPFGDRMIADDHRRRAGRLEPFARVLVLDDLDRRQEAEGADLADQRMIAERRPSAPRRDRGRSRRAPGRSAPRAR
jgi:hypothetical protein